MHIIINKSGLQREGKKIIRGVYIFKNMLNCKLRHLGHACYKLKKKKNIEGIIKTTVKKRRNTNFMGSAWKNICINFNFRSILFRWVKVQKLDILSTNKFVMLS